MIQKVTNQAGFIIHSDTHTTRCMIEDAKRRGFVVKIKNGYSELWNRKKEKK